MYIYYVFSYCGPFFPTENKRAAMQCQNADAAAKVTLLARRREK